MTLSKNGNRNHYSLMLRNWLVLGRSPILLKLLVTVHEYEVKPWITLIFTDSFLTNRLFYDKIIYYHR